MSSPATREIIAAQAAAGFNTLQCAECAAAIRSALLATGYHGETVELRSAGGWDFMICISHDGGRQSITQNGRHVGIRVNETAFDNLHPQGMSYGAWLADFDAPLGIGIESVTPF
jgi:hypothetical protein